MAVQSLSARRAWIEIPTSGTRRYWNWVALRKESVDRNSYRMMSIPFSIRSLSARRAWIEISVLATRNRMERVALRKESVDRNGEYLRVLP